MYFMYPCNSLGVNHPGYLRLKSTEDSPHRIQSFSPKTPVHIIKAKVPRKCVSSDVSEYSCDSAYEASTKKTISTSSCQVKSSATLFSAPHSIGISMSHVLWPASVIHQGKQPSTKLTGPVDQNTHTFFRPSGAACVGVQLQLAGRKNIRKDLCNPPRRRGTNIFGGCLFVHVH